MEETTKQRALRIALHYYRLGIAATYWKGTLSIVALLLSAGYLAWLLAADHEQAFSPAPVSLAHAAWDAQCSECHEPFLPLRADAWQANKPAHMRAVAKKCQACHPAAAHNVLLTEQSHVSEAGCTSCHVEHRGAEVSLVRIADGHCTHCHAQLKPLFPEPVQLKFHPQITSFALEEILPQDVAQWPHPEFRSLKADPGNVKFNHALHMQAGLPKQPTGVPQLKYADVEQTYLQKFVPHWKPGENDAALVQLECTSCHEAEQNAATNKQGEFMQPIQYEQHCRACHPLNLSSQPNSSMPHALPPAALQQAVVGWLLQAEKAAPETQLQQFEDKLLGKNSADLLAQSPEFTERVEQAQALVHERCSKCHSFENNGAAWLAPIVPSAIPQRWFAHSRFSHAAHATTKCVTCHPGTTAETQNKSTEKTWDEELVMIRNYDSCVECHSPTAISNPQTGVLQARSDCVECHTYHGTSHAQKVEQP